MAQNEWIVLTYTLPRDPSRLRVSVWRRLKKTGAINFQQSMWILPFSQTHMDTMEKVRDEISKNSGESFLMKTSMDEEGQSRIIIKFNAAREEEYKEFLEKCADFFMEIDKEIARENYTFAEIEENEEELDKLKVWLDKIESRDFFEAPAKGMAREMLKKCEDMLETFCCKVYDSNHMG